jgi:threonine dehydrogenase-like Zn-dependent dehydrogenase
MRALHFVEAGKVEWRETPAPTIQHATDALVRPTAGAACDLDAAIVAGITPYPAPYVLGHEAAGEVLDVGDGVRGFKPGDQVVIPFEVSCGFCAFCRRGLTANCVNVPRTSMYGIGAAGGDWGGTYADVVRVPFADHMLVPLPAGVSPSVASRVSDNVADGYRTVAAGLAAYPGAPVLILSGGLKGSIPLYAVLIARALGAGRIDFHDGDRNRLAAAERLGATPHETPEWPKRLGAYPITVESTQSPDGLACALRSTEPGGTCTSVSIFFQPLVGVPMTEMYMKGITLTTGRVHASALLPPLLRLVESGVIDPDAVETQTVAWDSLPEAILDFGLKLVAVR